MLQRRKRRQRVYKEKSRVNAIEDEDCNVGDGVGGMEMTKGE